MVNLRLLFGHKYIIQKHIFYAAMKFQFRILKLNSTFKKVLDSNIEISNL